MKIKLFVVTYNAPHTLDDTLNSLFTSDFDQAQEVTVINNHSNFSLDREFSNKVKVLHNQGRPDFSTGHLSRNWNQALIHGFKNLAKPDTDIVIHVQDDTKFEPTWFSDLLQLHQQYSFISDGVGDNLCSYTADAVKHIGIWDERFCNIGFQEADYFLRAYLYNREKSSINDGGHYRVWNPISKSLVHRPNSTAYPRTLESLTYHDVSLQIFQMKWSVTAAFWDHPNFFSAASQIRTPNIPTYVTYPYFEKDILDLKEKGYVYSF